MLTELLKSKPNNKSATNRQKQQQIERIRGIQSLLRVELLPVKKRRLQHYQQDCKLETKSSKKSIQSLQNRLEPIYFIQKTEHAKIINTQSHIQETLKPEIKQRKVQQQNDGHQKVKQFVQKKMKIGHKKETNAIKKFIMQTLAKANAEGSCLVIHKGTGQSNYSPVNHNQSSLKSDKIQKSKVPLVVIEESGIIRSNRNIKSIFGNRPIKPLPNAQKRTVINLPSLKNNKIWVDMVKQHERKNQKIEQKPQQHCIPEMIQQNNSLAMLIPQEIQQKIELENNQIQEYDEINIEQ